MCGRLTLKTAPDQWGQLLLPLLESLPRVEQFEPRYNIAPTQSVLAVANFADDLRPSIGGFRWGLVPSWSKDPSIGSKMINARSETLQEKRSFQGPLAERRCLVIADGYYEWQQISSKSKQPYWIAPASGGIMLLAGLWEVNHHATSQPLRSCTIITTAANASLSVLHHRMPVVLNAFAARKWLDRKASSTEAYEMLGSVDEEYFQVRPVSPRVNNVRNDDAACLEIHHSSLF